MNPEIFNTYGIEFETSCIPRKEVKNSAEIANLGFVDKRDASIESYTYEIENFTFENILPGFSGDASVTGSELVSNVLHRDNALATFKKLTNWISENGEEPQSQRCGVHFHISMDYNLSVLKKIIQLSSHLEDVFFYVGGMGYPFRGQENDSIYFRPTTKKGPVVINTAAGNVSSIFNNNDLLKAETNSDFWYKYGDVLNNGDNGRSYIPVRYHWINLFPLYYQRSLEFRVFNASLNPHHLWAALELCRAFCIYAFQSRDGDEVLKEHSIFTSRSKKSIISTLESFVEKVDDFPEDALQYLVEIINQTPKISLKNEYVWCHLRDYRYPFDDYEYTPNSVVAKSVKSPDFVDIHNIDRGDIEGRPVAYANNGGVRVNNPEDNGRQENNEENAAAVAVDRLRERMAVRLRERNAFPAPARIIPDED